jgi:hypothetical protein|tara:strand:+ start:320 stop:655 length:336 start_codon:yes stop_codon:yes gene_type:complete
MIKIKFRIQNRLTGKGSLDPESFVVAWQRSQDIAEVYALVEGAWREQWQFPVSAARSFYTSREVGLRQLRARATKYRNKGVPLKTLRGEIYSPKSTAVDYERLSALAKEIG